MRSFIAAHRLIVGAIALVTAGTVAFVLVYFEPQTLFIDRHVDEPLPTVTAGRTTSASDQGRGSASHRDSEDAVTVVAEGPFQSYEHSTTGRARILRLADGSRFLRFDHFETSNGPDVRVYLSAAESGGSGDGFDDEYVELGELKGNIGDQNYVIPSAVKLGQFRSAIVWCKRFSVPFGSAPLD